MKAKELAKLVVQYHTCKDDKPDPKCSKCSGTGIETWYCHHNGNEEKSSCECLQRTKHSIKEKVGYYLSVGGKELFKICKAYLK